MQFGRRYCAYKSDTMKTIRILFLCFLYLQTIVNSARLPTYIDRCSRSNPLLNACILKYGNRAISRIVKGDINYDIPYMLPLKINQLVIRNDSQLLFILRNVEVYGLQNTKIRDANFQTDAKQQHISAELNMTNHRLTIVGDYELCGIILNQFLNGSDRANITILDGLYTSELEATIDTEHYGHITSQVSKYVPTLVRYQFINLFSQSDFLGFQTNLMLNYNWRKVSNEFRPGANKAVNDLISYIFRKLAELIPLNEIFGP